MNIAPVQQMVPVSREPRRERLQSIQIMRGIAAIAVVFYHTHIILAQPRYGSIEIFGPVASKGWLGVNLFFMLSGFIILHAHASDINMPGKLGSYFWKRFSRVYPVYWVFLTLYLMAAAAGLGSPDFSWSPLNLASAYLLFQLTPDLALPLQVAWTLFYEVNFYILFAVLLINRTAGLIVMVGWAAAAIIANVAFGSQSFGLLHVWNLYFIAGMLVFLVTPKVSSRLGLPLVIVGCIFLAALASTLPQASVNEQQENLLAIGLLILPIAMILLGGILAERNFTLNYPAFLVGLGSASYSIYLVHSAIISLLAVLKVKFAVNYLPDVVVFLGVMSVSVIGGVFAHLFVEKPLLVLMRGRRSAAVREPSGRGLGAKPSE